MHIRPPQKNRNNRNKNGRKPMGNVSSRVYESAGPEGKVRGTPQQIIEKYLLLARDSQTSGDRVTAENFLQHAEHYIRLLGATQVPGEQRVNNQFPGPGRADYDDLDDEADGEDDGSQQPAYEPVAADRQHNDRQPHDERHQGERQQGDRQQGERQQGERRQNDRPQGERRGGERQNGDRQNGDRQNNERQNADRQNGERAQQDRAQQDRSQDRPQERSQERSQRQQPERAAEQAAPERRDVIQPVAAAEPAAFVAAPSEPVPAPISVSVSALATFDAGDETESTLVATPESAVEDVAPKKPAPRRRRRVADAEPAAAEPAPVADEAQAG